MYAVILSNQFIHFNFKLWGKTSLCISANITTHCCNVESYVIQSTKVSTISAYEMQLLIMNF